MYKFLIILIVIVCPVYIFGLSVGSNSAFSRQANVTFPSADTDNTMLGFAVFEQGFSLADQFTTCTFNDVFPVSGLVMLNAGRLYLLQDLVFANTMYFGIGGGIYGNGSNLCFSHGSIIDNCNKNGKYIYR